MNRYCLYLVAGTGLALLLGAAPAFAQTAPALGSVQSFAVLAGSTVTDTGSSLVTGDLGVSPGSAITGFPPGLVVSGTAHAADATALAAQNSLTTAYGALTSQACTQDLTGQDLGGLTLTAGVYCFSTSAQLTGTLTLDAQGNSAAVFIFKIGSTLTTASGASVVLINNGSLCNVFWQVGSSATLGTDTSFAGSILAQASITLNTGATVTGRTLARTGAVTLDSSNVTVTCPGGATPPPSCPAITLSPATLPSGTVGVAYSQTILGSGGTTPYSFAVTSGTLPPGLTLTPAGVVVGTPTGPATSTVTIRGTDASGCFSNVTYTLVIAPAPPPPPSCPAISITPSALPAGRVGVAYQQTLAGSGGTAPYIFGVVAGALPAGLTLSAAGLLAGTPLTPGTSSVTIRGNDASGCYASVTYTLVIAAAPPPPPSCPAISITPSSPLPDGRVGVAYLQTLVGSGGTGPYSFGVTAGALPAGLTLSAAGVLTGTALAPGMSSAMIRGTDANGCFASVTYALMIAAALPPPPSCPTISITPPTLPDGTVGSAYNQTLVASGGTAPYTYGITVGALPTGLTLTAAGMLSGTPITGGTSTITIRATETDGCFTERSFSLLVPTPVPTLPEVFLVLLALGLAFAGYVALRRLAPRETDRS